MRLFSLVARVLSIVIMQLLLFKLAGGVIGFNLLLMAIVSTVFTLVTTVDVTLFMIMHNINKIRIQQSAQYSERPQDNTDDD